MVVTALALIRIVLVEPAGPLNVGAIARVMKNMGLHNLVLVNPQCDPLDGAARQMAVHAGDVLEAAQQVATLPLALQGCQRAIATTVRTRTTQTRLESPRSGLPWLLEPPLKPASLPQHSALIFGPEDRGLSNTELNYAQRFVRISSSPTYPSLNLAQAVAICCYELYQSAYVEPVTALLGSQTLHPLLPPGLEMPASIDALEGYYQQLEAVLLKIGYLYPHTVASRMEKFRRLFNRTQLSDAEIRMLRGILTQVTWALQAEPGSNQTS